MYTVNDFIRKLEEIRAEHGGETPVVVPTTDRQLAYENAAVSVVNATPFVDVEGGEVFMVDDGSQSVVAVVF